MQVNQCLCQLQYAHHFDTYLYNTSHVKHKNACKLHEPWCSPLHTISSLIQLRSDLFRSCLPWHRLKVCHHALWTQSLDSLQVFRRSKAQLLTCATTKHSDHYHINLSEILLAGLQGRITLTKQQARHPARYVRHWETWNWELDWILGPRKEQMCNHTLEYLGESKGCNTGCLFIIIVFI